MDALTIRPLRYGEDRTPSRNLTIVGALAILRNVLQVIVIVHRGTYDSMPASFEVCASDTDFILHPFCFVTASSDRQSF